MHKIFSEPVFVGRAKELKNIIHALDETRNGNGLTIFISGPAGSGKTRLINEFLKIAKKKEVIVLYGWCLSDTAIPYFPFVEAFDSYFYPNKNLGSTGFQKNFLKSLLSSNQSTSYEKLNNQPYLWKDHFFQEIAKELLFLSVKKPLVLIIEDIHWADSASLSLIHYIARQLSSEKILILCTFRIEEIVDSNGQPSQLYKLLSLMSREALFKKIELPNLRKEDVAKIAESMLHQRVNASFIKKLTIDSNGIPLFIVEYLRLLYQNESLFRKNNELTLNANFNEIPAKVKDVILCRLSVLTPYQRRILDVASVIGERFDPKVIAEVLTDDSIEILTALNNIEKSTFMVRCEADIFRFDHIKIRELLYEEMPKPLKKEYHCRVAKQLENENKSDEVISDLARHYLSSENKEKAVQYSIKAGNIALLKSSNEEAIKHFSYIIDESEIDPKLISQRLIALEGIGDALAANNLFNESIRYYQKLSDSAEDPPIKLRASRKAMDSAFHLGKSSILKKLIKKSEPYATADRLEYGRLLMCRGRSNHLQFKVSEATKDMEEALKIFEEENSVWDVAWSLIGLGIYHAGRGFMQQGLSESLRSISLFKDLRDFRWQMEAYYVAGTTFNVCFLEAEALKMFAQVEQINKAENIGDYLRLVFAYANAARSLEAVGNFKKALSFSLKALELTKKTDSIPARAIVYSNLSRQYAITGNKTKAEEYFNALMQIPSENLKDIRVMPLLIELARPVLYASKGDWKKSDQYFEEILSNKKGKSPASILAINRLYYIWTLEKREKIEEAKEMHKINKKIRHDVVKKFYDVNIRAYFMTPSNVDCNKNFELFLNIINTSNFCARLLRIENLIDPMLEVVSFTKGLLLKENLISFESETISPFKVKEIKLSCKTKQPGEIRITPRVIFSDNSGKIRTIAANTKCISVFQDLSKLGISRSFESMDGFKTEYTRRAFDFLVRAFLKDYTIQKLTLEKAGWRTFMEIVREGHVSKYSLYGRFGKGGKAISELIQQGLVESRFFFGERGRGARVCKVRINQEKEAVRQYIDNH